MAAKQKAPDDNNGKGPNPDTDNLSEIEKKIDAMMSMESPAKNAPETPPDSEAVPEPAPDPLPQLKPIKINVSEAEPDNSVMQVTSDFGQPAIKEAGPPLLPEKNGEKSPALAEEPVAAQAESQAVDPEKNVGELPLLNEQTADELGLEDVSTGKAVDEIIAGEADELLEVRDRGVNTDEPVQPPSQASSRKGIAGFLSAWWHSKRYRYITLAVVFTALAAAVAIPTSRYFVLNTAGVRSAASVTVLDETTGQPLKNAEFKIGTQSGRTDTEGTIKLHDLRLGRSDMLIKKAGFADVSWPLTLGWGSNPLGEFRLKPVGNQYKITVSDFLSKKPLSKVEASSGEANARSNDKGEIVLTVPRTSNDEEKIEVRLAGEGLRDEDIQLALGNKEAALVSMVPSRKHVFISKRSGTYDLYKVDADGKNEEIVLAGTGSERPESIAVAAHPTKNIAALVSARDNSRNKDGFVLSSLNIIDLDDNKATKIAQSERVQMVGWIDNRLVYVKIADGASAASPNRHRLVSYDLGQATEKELASTNYFNDILMVGKSIYYTPAAYNVNGSVGLFKTNADGSDKKTIYDKEVWNLFRTSYDKLSVSMGQEWFELHLNTDVLTRAASAPPVLKTRIYVPRTDSSISLWSEERDGKGTLLRYDSETKTDDILRSQSGLKNPLHWLSSTHVIYRINNNQETADYIFSTDGGEPRKIVDVTDTAGIDRWYYY